MSIELLKHSLHALVANYDIIHKTIIVEPMGKPRMTQRDRWKKRPATDKYYVFKDALRYQCKAPKRCIGISWIAYISIPKSRKKDNLDGLRHAQRPDKDNIEKGILDTLFKEDSHISIGYSDKRWDDGKGARIELYFHCIKD